MNICSVSMELSIITQTDGEKTWWQLHKNAVSNIEEILETTPHKAVALRPPTTHRENYQN